MCGCRSPVYRRVWLSVASIPSCVAVGRQYTVMCGCRSPVYRHVWLSVASIPSCTAVGRQYTVMYGCRSPVYRHVCLSVARMSHQNTAKEWSLGASACRQNAVIILRLLFVAWTQRHQTSVHKNRQRLYGNCSHAKR